MSNRENTQKSLIEFALKQLRQAIDDTQAGRTSTASDNLSKICEEIAQAEHKKNKNEISEEELQEQITQIANKVK